MIEKDGELCLLKAQIDQLLIDKHQHSTELTYLEQQLTELHLTNADLQTQLQQNSILIKDHHQQFSEIKHLNEQIATLNQNLQ